MSRDFSEDGAAAEAILAFLADGVERGAPEIAEAIGMDVRTLRTHFSRLGDVFKVQSRRSGSRNLTLYRLADRRRPFLLGEVWRTAFEAGEVVA